MTDTWARRSLLASCAALAGGLAGCTTFTADDDEVEGGDGDESDSSESDDATAEADATGETSDEDGSGDGTDGSDESGGDTDGGDESDGGAGDDADEDGGDGTDDDDLDLQEANVTAVETADAGDGEYEFSVTLYHDDDGEDGYANWWQVETREGQQLGRRDLLHAHSTDPFTRSETIAIPADVDCVVVRGHDQTHEYGGQAMLVSVPDGVIEARRQGSEPESFDGADCP